MACVFELTCTYWTGRIDNPLNSRLKRVFELSFSLFGRKHCVWIWKGNNYSSLSLSATVPRFITQQATWMLSFSLDLTLAERRRKKPPPPEQLNGKLVTQFIMLQTAVLWSWSQVPHSWHGTGRLLFTIALWNSIIYFEGLFDLQKPPVIETLALPNRTDNLWSLRTGWTHNYRDLPDYYSSPDDTYHLV